MAETKPRPADDSHSLHRKEWRASKEVEKLSRAKRNSLRAMASSVGFIHSVTDTLAERTMEAERYAYKEVIGVLVQNPSSQVTTMWFRLLKATTQPRQVY